METTVEVKHLEGWLTASEAASELAVSRQRVHQMMMDGTFKNVRFIGDGRPTYLLKATEVRILVGKRYKAKHAKT